MHAAASRFSRHLAANTTTAAVYEIPLYCINMERSRQRLADFRASVSHTNTLLAAHGYVLVPHRFDAYDCQDGQRLADKLHAAATAAPCCLSDAEIGCTVSHVACVEQCVANDERLAIICEDDIDLVHFGRFFNEFVAHFEATPDDMQAMQLVAMINPPNQIYTHNNTAHLPPPPPLNQKWQPYCYSSAMYVITRDGMRDVCEKYLVAGKVRLANERTSVADHAIFSATHSYVTRFPFCRLQAETSTIHEHHLSFHQKVVDEIEAFIAQYGEGGDGDGDGGDGDGGDGDGGDGKPTEPVSSPPPLAS
jgi:hypothetical protein